MTDASGSGKKQNPYYQGPVSDHYDGLRFFNPEGVEPGNLLDVMKWKLGGGRARWPNPVVSAFPPAKPDRHVFGDALRVTMVGHASMLIQVAGLNILTDPVWSERASPFTFAGPKRVVPPGIRFEDLPPIDLVLVSHNHYDHLDLVTLKRLHEVHAPDIVTPLGNDTIIKRGVPGAKIATMDWGDHLAISDRVTIDAEPCHHWSARGATIDAWRSGPPSSSPRRRARSTMSAIPAFMAVSIMRRFGKSTAASASPSCPSAPMSRAGSCAASTRTRRRRFAA